MSKNFYITTTIPYVNSDPHIGFALELVQSDIFARYQRLQGREVFFSTGTDEYGQKIWEASQKEGKNVQDYVDSYAQKFLELKDILNLSIDNFIRTTSGENIVATQEFWRLCNERGDIYKKKYKGLYCVGCEKFITDKDLVSGRCPLHPSKDLEEVEEENYFFKLSNYRQQLLEYLSAENVIYPEWRRKEAVSVVENLEDFSISRNKARLSWGIEIPGDDTQVMYVWFGAFVNYISTLGWPNNKELFEKFWVNGEKIQTAGKDMVKFQSVMWQGMLLSAGLPSTDKVIYHGFVTGEGGIKMSKSLGNVINPSEVVNEYGTDALRYYFSREVSPFDDSPFTKESFKEAYNSKLANGLGNLVSRVMKMTTTNGVVSNISDSDLEKNFLGLVKKGLDDFNIQEATDSIWIMISSIDAFIQDKQPFKKIKVNPEEAKKDLQEIINGLHVVAYSLRPIMPKTAETILTLIKENKCPEVPLFARKD
jgi:methionyl-tRNA synthetase